MRLTRTVLAILLSPGGSILASPAMWAVVDDLTLVGARKPRDLGYIVPLPSS